MLQAGTAICAKYEIIRELGRGGMSVVYLAREMVTGKLLAIKDVARSTKDDNRIVEQTLAGEGRLLKRLDNPHLPKIYEIIEDTDSFMVVMDYVDGVSLDKVILQTGPQPLDRIYHWGMQVCEVFDYLHNQTPPIVYRDMKPANIMLQRDGNIMMIDFGTARTQKVGIAMQSDTVCLGTEGFAAPEQFGGISQSDARTDIYCFGGTLYNLATGHSPCDKPKGILPLEYWSAELAQTPLNYIITKCTKADPAERYQTAMELYEDLRLASLGAFQEPGKRGGSGLLRSGWQKQTLKGTESAGTGALSGLLGKVRGRSGGLKNAQDDPAAAAPAAPASGGWQSFNAQPAAANGPIQPTHPPMAAAPAQPQYPPQRAVPMQPQRPVQMQPPMQPQWPVQMQQPVPQQRSAQRQPLVQQQVRQPVPPAANPKQPAQPQPPVSPQVTDTVEADPATPWRKLMIFSGIAAVLLLIIGAVLLLVGVSLPGYLLMIVSVGAIALMVVGLLGVVRNNAVIDRNDETVR